MINGRYQQMPVHSDPAGAHIAVDCGDAPADGGVTPATVRLRRGAHHCAITLTKDGYAPETVTFEKHLSSQTFANIGLGFVTGLALGVAAAPSSILSEDDSASNAATAGVIGGTAAGILIDRSTGAMYRQAPGSVDVQLKGNR